MNWTNPWVVAVGGGVMVAAVSAASKAIKRSWRRLWAALRSKPFVPSETLRIVQDVHQSRWQLGTFNGENAMNVIFEGHVTDISGSSNQVLRAEIENPLTYAGILMLSDDHSSLRPQTLTAFECAEIHAMFTVQPVVCVAGARWNATLVFLDRYGNRHKVKQCVFRGLPAAPLALAQPPMA